MRRLAVLPFLLLLVAAPACSSHTTARGPVERTGDAVHATAETTGSTTRSFLEATGDIVVTAVTFPFRLIGGLFSALS